MDYRNAPANQTADWHLERDWQLFQSVESGSSGHLYRIWEVREPVVIAGRSNRLEDWVNLDACRRDDVGVVRRFSGGGAVVLGPGCLNYAVATSLVSCPELADVGASLRFVLRHIVAAFELEGLAIAAPSDLSLGGRKVSGNAQRRGRRAMLQHGTILYDFDPALAVRYLATPPREPRYRQRRSHDAFMGNVPLREGTIRERLVAALATLHSSRTFGAPAGRMHNGAYVPTRLRFPHDDRMHDRDAVAGRARSGADATADIDGDLHH